MAAVVGKSPSIFERIIAFIMMAVLIGVFSVILVTDVEIPPEKMSLAIILLAILGLVTGALLPALLNIQYQGGGITLRAAGGAALFISILYFGVDMVKPNLPTAPLDTSTGQRIAEAPIWPTDTFVPGQTPQQVTAYSGCFADYGLFGQQMVQSYYGMGNTVQQAQSNAIMVCQSTCAPFGGYCQALN